VELQEILEDAAASDLGLRVATCNLDDQLEIRQKHAECADVDRYNYYELTTQL
jgi:hypothetical protein